MVRLEVPPLHQRVDDIPLLVEHFLNEAGYAGPLAALVPPPLMATLQAHRWPGNVRELRNYVEAILAMGEPPSLEQAAGGPGAARASSPPAPSVAVPLEHSYREARQKVLEDFEIQFLKALMERAGNNVSSAARLRYRSGGEFWAPITVRAPSGGGIFGGQTHSQSVEAIFTHVCGLKTVIPSNPYDAKGLLISAVEDDDPVVFFEPKRLYHGPFSGYPDRPAVPWDGRKARPNKADEAAADETTAAAEATGAGADGGVAGRGA